MELMQRIHTIGGNGGSQFDYYDPYKGRVLERLEVWAAHWCIGAVRVSLSDDHGGITFGNNDEGRNLRYRAFTFNQGERMTELTLWGNGEGTRLGWIKFKTNQNREFDFGMYEWPQRTPYPMDIGSGICVGVYGRCGYDIDNMGFCFLSTIHTMRMINVQYERLRAHNADITQRSLRRYTNENRGSSARNWEFEGSQSVTNTSSWSVSRGLTTKMNVNVNAEILKVVTVGAGFEWQLAQSSSLETSQSTTESLSWCNSGTLNPGEKVDLEARIGKGSISTPFSATVEVVLQSGIMFRYPVQGMYEGENFTGVEVIDVR